jgi:hypothetical protein
LGSKPTIQMVVERNFRKRCDVHLFLTNHVSFLAWA